MNEVNLPGCRQIAFQNTRLAARPGIWLFVLNLVLASAMTAYYRFTDNAGLDFGVYRTGAGNWIAGKSLYIDFGYPMPFSYPPFAAILFTPLAWFPETLSFWLFTAVSFGSAGLVSFLFAKKLGLTSASSQVVALITCLFCWVLSPIFGNLVLGQINLILMGLITLGWWLSNTETPSRGKIWLAGICLGLAISIKIIPAGFCLLWLLTRKFKPLLIAGLTFVATTAVSFLIAGKEVFWYYTKVLFDVERPGFPSYIDNQSLRATLLRLGLGSPTDKLSALQPGTFVWLGTVLLLLLLVSWLILRIHQPAYQLLCCAGLVLLICPVSWTFHWCWLLGAVTIMVIEFCAGSSGRKLIHLVGFVFLLLIVFTLPLVGVTDWLTAVTGQLSAGFGWAGFGLKFFSALLGNSYLISCVAGIFWLAAKAHRLSEPTE